MSNQPPKIYVERTKYDDYRSWSEDNPEATCIHSSKFGAIGRVIASNPQKFGIEIIEAETEYFSGWTIKPYPSETGFIAETYTSTDKTPQQTFSAETKEEAVSKAKEWCIDNIPL